MPTACSVFFSVIGAMLVIVGVIVLVAIFGVQIAQSFAG
jgi:hypothetical protein